MSFLREFLDKQAPIFEKGGKLEKFYPIYEMIDTFAYTPGSVTKGSTHVRDGMDLKRMMVTVAMALMPCILMAMYNTGLQAMNAATSMGVTTLPGWRFSLFEMLGFGIDPSSFIGNMIYGALYFVPLFLVSNIAGGLVEVIFSTVRKHEINEGFLVTGILYPLTLPATMPLWQAALGIIFGVLFAKEIYGGTGKNFLNVALTARAFLFFAYPGGISGDAVWVAADGYTGATALGQVASAGMESLTIGWSDAFFGFIPGSMGETSTLASLLGAAYLIITGIGSWRIMISVLLSAVGLSLLFNIIGSETNHMFAMAPYWHIVLGGFAFGLVFMATDPVSSSMTQSGQYFYGALIGTMVILVRVINPAYPEGMMLAILFANLIAPLIDFFVIKANMNRRMARSAK